MTSYLVELMQQYVKIDGDIYNMTGAVESDVFKTLPKEHREAMQGFLDANVEYRKYLAKQIREMV